MPQNVKLEWYIVTAEFETAQGQTIPAGACLYLWPSAIPHEASVLRADGGWCKCEDYPQLFTNIGIQHGYDAETGAFRLPDHRDRETCH